MSSVDERWRDTKRNQGGEEMKGSFHQQVSSIFMIQIRDNVIIDGTESSPGEKES